MSKTALDRKTDEIARRHGCDRAVFTVCWGEHERGETCRCKQEAAIELGLYQQQSLLGLTPEQIRAVVEMDPGPTAEIGISQQTQE